MGKLMSWSVPKKSELAKTFLEVAADPRKLGRLSALGRGPASTGAPVRDVNVFWKTVASWGVLALQQHTLSANYRIIDGAQQRLASGSEPVLRDLLVRASAS